MDYSATIDDVMLTAPAPVYKCFMFQSKEGDWNFDVIDKTGNDITAKFQIPKHQLPINGF